MNKVFVYILLPIAFFVYLNSFMDMSILNKKIDVLADCDSASYAVLIKDFHVTETYGDEYNTTNRTLGDIAQKHKIHHFLYVMTGSLLYQFFFHVYRLFGVVSDNYALYSVNAFITCCNILCLNILLKTLIPSLREKNAYILLYSFSLSTWIYGSVLDSWPFTTLLLLIFLIMYLKFKLSPIALSIIVGFFMLSNVILGSMVLFIIIYYYTKRENRVGFLINTVKTIFLAVGSWAMSMFFLSIFDHSMTPINYVKYTLWFKKFISYQLHIYDLYVWKVVLTNFYINSVLSNQADPSLPQEALLFTIKTSVLGLFSTAIYLLFAGVTMFNIYKNVKNMLAINGFKSFLEKPIVSICFYGIALIFLPLFWFPPATFLYSVTFVPIMVITSCYFNDTDDRLTRMVLYIAVIMVIINNTSQISMFRNVLRHMI